SATSSAAARASASWSSSKSVLLRISSTDPTTEPLSRTGSWSTPTAATRSAARRRGRGSSSRPARSSSGAKTESIREPSSSDRTAIQRAYRRERLRRRAREERAREKQLAGLRFWLAVTAVIATSIGLAILIWHEIHRLFGL